MNEVKNMDIDKDACKTVIATNAPEYFSDNENCKFIALGTDNDQKASYVILMLKSNWNISSIKQIEALINHISSYPPSVPAIILGAEFQFPFTGDFEKIKKVFKDVERDSAVKKLCNVVLARSRSIGVRGHITKQYLVEVLGFSSNEIEVIYDQQASVSEDSLKDFVKTNIPFLESNIAAIHHFQKKPKVFNEVPLNFDRRLVVGKPYLKDTGDKVKLCLDVTLNGELKCLWVETKTLHAKYFTVDRLDPFLLILIPFAMRNGHNIESQTPATDRLLYNIREVLIPNLCAGDKRLYHTSLLIPSCGEALPSGKLTATGMSCGIDSFYSTMSGINSNLESHRLNAIYCGNYLYGNDGLIFERARKVAKELELPFVSTSTNINEELGLPHLETHFYKTLFGVIALRRFFKAYYYSSAGNFTNFSLKRNGSNDTSLYELLLLYVFSDENFQILSGGGGITRLEKTRRLINFAPAQSNLNVCIYPNRTKNCGKCGKCLRTLLTLDMLGALDKFDKAFDTDDYRLNREEHMRYLKGRSNDYMLKEVYEHFFAPN